MLELGTPTEQACQVCGQSYTGIRARLCENIECRKLFAMECERNAYKYGPISYPKGAIFYDIGQDAEECSVEKIYSEKHKETFAKIAELGKKLLGKEKCDHNWVMDGHNAGDPICSKCYRRE